MPTLSTCNIAIVWLAASTAKWPVPDSTGLEELARFTQAIPSCDTFNLRDESVDRVRTSELFGTPFQSYLECVALQCVNDFNNQERFILSSQEMVA